MDVDALIARRRGAWERLARLSKARRLSGAEVDELLDEYGRTATDLSLVRSTAPDPALVGYLSAVLARARVRSSSSRTLGWSSLAGFFVEVFPAALYRMRWWWGVTALINVVLGLALGAWLVQNPVVENTLISTAEIQQLVDADFENYYSENPASSFAAQVWVNNAWVAAQCIALGVLGLPVLYVLWQNISNVAVIASLMHAEGRGSLFWGLITPHGLLELTAIFVAAGVGLRLFWSWVDPGPRTRWSSLAQEGRTAAGVSMGLVVVLLISGLIEAFVTPSPLPTWARVAVGVVALALFLLYVFTLGRWAVRAGRTGDVQDSMLPSERPSAF
ncbi:MAG TPA: stage II sporulation protein M [Ornithinimicrobium sp.]|uniref:stage II sporulation protein M n=1 Tax=Ornithinimicrobium sp. TaxID=1977084 RepID=UPI002B4A36DD|nr:stage II sporulation protein M [Ornithinimicrobium sp.]HKJ12647.1 stage II sporulation protein M [Ornithinimicrobium sp.]